MTEVEYLGLIITAKVVQTDMDKVCAVLDWATPRTVKDVQSFLGFANFYRRFIQGFSSLAGPLTQLTKKDQPFQWTPKCQNMVLSHVSAMTLVHVGYIIEFLWGQRHAPGDSGEGLFL